MAISHVKVPVSVNGYKAHIEIAEGKRIGGVGYVSVPKDAESALSTFTQDEVFGALTLTNLPGKLLFRSNLATQDAADEFVENTERALVAILKTLPAREVSKRGRKAKTEVAAAEQVAETTEVAEVAEVEEVAVVAEALEAE